MKRLFNGFVKVTGWPVQKLLFRTKIYYEDKAVQKRRIKGPAIVICNHTSVYDYAVLLFVFWQRTLRCQMAECLFKRRFLKYFLKALGGIFVDRDAYDFAFVRRSLDILLHKGVVGIFPEARLPLAGEERPLPFKTSAAYIALESGAPVIPVYTNGKYFCKERAEVIIGKPIDARALWQDGADERTNIETITKTLRERVIQLGNELGKQSAARRKRGGRTQKKKES